MTNKTEKSDIARPPKAGKKPPRKLPTASRHGRKGPAPALNGKTAEGNNLGDEAEQKTPSRTLRTDFGLSRSTFAKLAGIPQSSLQGWEEGKSIRLKDGTRVRIRRVASILKSLARVMRREFIPTWIEQPNEACKETGAATPLELFERGDFESLEDMIWYLESGSPS